jgi:hypothetical protein
VAVLVAVLVAVALAPGLVNARYQAANGPFDFRGLRGALLAANQVGLAVTTIAAFSARLRQEVDLDTLTVELLAVVEQTMQPTQTSLWLRQQEAPRAVAPPVHGYHLPADVAGSGQRGPSSGNLPWAAGVRLRCRR